VIVGSGCCCWVDSCIPSCWCCGGVPLGTVLFVFVGSCSRHPAVQNPEQEQQVFATALLLVLSFIVPVQLRNDVKHVNEFIHILLLGVHFPPSPSTTVTLVTAVASSSFTVLTVNMDSIDTTTPSPLPFRLLPLFDVAGLASHDPSILKEDPQSLASARDGKSAVATLVVV